MCRDVLYVIWYISNKSVHGGLVCLAQSLFRPRKILIGNNKPRQATVGRRGQALRRGDVTPPIVRADCIEVKGLLQCKFFNLSVLRCIHPEKSRIKHQIFTCPKVDNHKARKKPISVRDVTNVYGHHTHWNKRRTCMKCV